MIPIIPCGSQRSKGVPSGTGDFLTLVGDPHTCPNFRLWQIAIPIQNATTRGVRSGPKMSENAQFWVRKYFSTKYLRTCSLNHPKTLFCGTFQWETYSINPYYTESPPSVALNGATTLKLYGYIGIGKFLEVCQNFSAGGAGPLNVNLGTPYYLGNYWS